MKFLQRQDRKRANRMKRLRGLHHPIAALDQHWRLPDPRTAPTHGKLICVQMLDCTIQKVLALPSVDWSAVAGWMPVGEYLASQRLPPR